MSVPTYGEMRTRAERIADGNLKERIIDGLEFLQVQYGKSFAEQINCDTLDLSEGYHCVLGQLGGGHFDEALLFFEKDVDWATAHGFYVPWRPEQTSYDYQAWAVLDDAWHAVLCDKEAIPTY